MPPNPIQHDIYERLRAVLPPELVSWEWSISKGAHDTFSDIRSYAPRLDIGVGPFNISFLNRHNDTEAVRQFRPPVVERILDAVRVQNEGDFVENQNPRCLMGIEIECTTSSKHILGGMTNASLLSRIGVLVGSPIAIDKVRRIHRYVRKLIEVEKADPNMFANLGCFSHDEFRALIF